ncbi:MAG TPA: Crp/Fnr family transcriptional regulator [Beijerinckiaceae bacterium]
MAERADSQAILKSSVLARHEFFSGMPDATIERLCSHARLSTHPPGKQIFQKGDEGLGLFAVISGLVEISVPSEEGKKVVLNLIGVNEIFGELALLDGGPRTADAVTLKETQLLSLDRRDFINVLEHEPGLGIRLLALVTARLRKTSEQVEDTSFAEPQKRLAKALLRLLDMQSAAPAEKGGVAITQKELGRMIGLSRESTNKYLREWEGLGWVALRKGAVIIKDRDALGDLVSGVPA